MQVVDTNVLLYAADVDSEFHSISRDLLEQLRHGAAPLFVTWGICYEFLRVSTHPRVFRSPWEFAQAWQYVSSLLAARSVQVLTATDRHGAVLAQTMREYPEMRGNIMHDLHTAVLMREHGVSRICTRDSDFHRFRFLSVIDPLH